MSSDQTKKSSIEVCFSPALFEEILTAGEFTVVVVDILRATTSFIAALQYGVDCIIPLAGVDKALDYKNKGFLVAVERDGRILDFADFGNSAYNFMSPKVQGKTIAYSTTNGTQAIEIAKNSKKLLIGAFTNLAVLSDYLIQDQQDVVILCAGWKNKFNLEDSVFAGALTEALLKSERFTTECDSANAAIDLWEKAKFDPLAYIQKAQHRERLRRLGVDDVLEYTFTMNSSGVLPTLVDGALIDILSHSSKSNKRDKN